MSAEWNSENFLAQTDAEDERLWDLLSAYADGETTPEESALVEAHLRSDAAYARDFAFLQGASRHVMLMGEVEPPTALRDAIFAATIHKPTFARRLAAAWGNFQTAINPRYAYPAGALAAGVCAAFLLWSRPAIAPNQSNSAPAVAATPNIETVAPVVPPSAKRVSPQHYDLKKPQLAGNNKPKIVVPTIELRAEDFFGTQAHQASKPSVKNDVLTVAKRTEQPKKPNANLMNAGLKETIVTPKATNPIVKINTPTTDMDRNDKSPGFMVVPNMDQQNQRTIVRSDPPNEPLPGDEAPAATADATTNSTPEPPSNAPRTFRVRNSRKLPDVRSLATAVPTRGQSEFQQGMTHSTILAMQREEIAGNTMTRF